MQRRHHYERAFEEYLRRGRIPYVAVDEARKALLPVGVGPGSGDSGLGSLKSFDFVVYGRNANLLIDIKGRRVGPPSGRAGDGGCDPSRAAGRVGRLESWVTEDDIDSLTRWQGLFGPGFEGAFVFIYWCDAQPPDALFQEVFDHRGVWYALRCVRLTEYVRAMKPRSPRWRTVHVPRAAFEIISQPFAPLAEAAPASLLEPGREGVFDPDPGPVEPALEPLGPRY